MFEEITIENIKQRILGRLENQLQTREGSYTNDVVSAAAAEICECYHAMDALVPAFYIDESSGAYIDRQAATVGVTRKPGTMASCTITFTGDKGAVVPAGAQFYTATGLAFDLQQEVTITGSTGHGTLKAVDVGDEYNIGSGEITSTLRNYPGIKSYTNESADGGSDPETDKALLDRYLIRMRRAATSGNPYHYQLWASDVPGVGGAKILSKWDGPGTVKVVLADPNMEPPGSGVVEAATAYIEAKRPIGPAVTVVAAGAENITVAAAISVDATTSKPEVQQALHDAVAGYLKELATDAYMANVDVQYKSLESSTYTVLYNRIVFLLLSIKGVVDYTSLTVNGLTKNVTIAADKLQVLKGVTVT